MNRLLRSESTVDLTDHVTTMQYLVVLDEAGVPYSTQAGGTMCAHPVAIGHLIPFRFNEPDGWGAKISDMWWDYEEDAKELRELLASFHDPNLRTATIAEIEAAVTEGLVTNDFGEAWLPVVIRDLGEREWYDRGPEYGFRNRLAILVWENSD